MLVLLFPHNFLFDGVISCSKCGVGILEIKCPYGKGTDKWRNKEPEECSSNKNFFAELSDTGKLLLKKNTRLLLSGYWTARCTRD